MLCKQFNPRTLQATDAAQQLETHPRGATKMSEMPARLLEWEKNLQRCITEGREPPNDEYKRLALLRMIPPKERAAIWETANKLYPTFAELLKNVHRIIQEDTDEPQGLGPMDVDNVEEHGQARP